MRIIFEKVIVDELICNVSLYYSEDEEPMILQETLAWFRQPFQVGNEAEVGQYCAAIAGSSNDYEVYVEWIIFLSYCINDTDDHTEM